MSISIILKTAVHLAFSDTNYEILKKKLHFVYTSRYFIIQYDYVIRLYFNNDRHILRKIMKPDHRKRADIPPLDYHITILLLTK